MFRLIIFIRAFLIEASVRMDAILLVIPLRLFQRYLPFATYLDFPSIAVLKIYPSHIITSYNSLLNIYQKSMRPIISSKIRGCTFP